MSASESSIRIHAAQLGLKLLSEIFEDDISQQAGNDGDRKIRDRENILDRKGQRFPVSIYARELAHQEVGIEQEDYEGDLNDRSPDRGQSSRSCELRGHSASRSFFRLILSYKMDATNLNLSRIGANSWLVGSSGSLLRVALGALQKCVTWRVPLFFVFSELRRKLLGMVCRVICADSWLRFTLNS
jgi:hypothetical protein